MQIDSFTVLLAGVLVKALLTVLLFVFWLNDRRSTCFAWWSGTFAFATAGTVVFVLRGFGGEVLAVGIGVAALIGAFACCWEGARAFEGRRPLWFPVLLAPAIWIGVCLLPGFLDSVPARVVVSSLLIAGLIVMSAVEFWRGRDERLPSRWPVIVVLGMLAMVFLSRVALLEVLPFPFGALPTRPSYVAAFNLLIFFHTLVLTVLMVALSKERLELVQRQRAQTDPLTGALNRRAFMARGNRLLSRHQHDKTQLCLMFLDLDHFKSLNDRFGHAGGDDVLTKFVSVVHENIRPTDFLFRFGGEEFCCLLPNTTADQAHRVAERIRQRFEVTTVDVAGAQVNATVSLGIASTETFGYDLDMLIRRADMAVYAAKRAGRNRVVVATMQQAPEPDVAVTGGGAVGAA